MKAMLSIRRFLYVVIVILTVSTFCSCDRLCFVNFVNNSNDTITVEYSTDLYGSEYEFFSDTFVVIVRNENKAFRVVRNENIFDAFICCDFIEPIDVSSSPYSYPTFDSFDELKQGCRCSIFDSLSSMISVPIFPREEFEWSDLNGFRYPSIRKLKVLKDGQLLKLYEGSDASDFRNKYFHEDGDKTTFYFFQDE